MAQDTSKRVQGSTGKSGPDRPEKRASRERLVLDALSMGGPEGRSRAINPNVPNAARVDFVGGVGRKP